MALLNKFDDRRQAGKVAGGNPVRSAHCVGLKKQGCQTEYDRLTALPLSAGQKISRFARTYLVGTIEQLELVIKLDVRCGG